MRVVLFLFCFLYVTALNAHTASEVFAKNSQPTIGIICAVPAECGDLSEHMDSCNTEGGRNFYKGKLHGFDTVFVASRIGKVAAAATATHLIAEYKVDLVIFIGVAGAVDPALNVGDVVIGTSLIQHDMDARPFCPVYEIPLLKIKACNSDPLLESLASKASQEFIRNELTSTIPQTILNEFGIQQSKTVHGLIITGDQVISQEEQKVLLKEKLPEALCVEMEGASVAQVCYEYNTPFIVIRTISDFANHQHSPTDVKKFVNQVSGYYAQGILNNLFLLIKERCP